MDNDAFPFPIFVAENPTAPSRKMVDSVVKQLESDVATHNSTSARIHVNTSKEIDSRFSNLCEFVRDLRAAIQKRSDAEHTKTSDGQCDCIDVALRAHAAEQLGSLSGSLHWWQRSMSMMGDSNVPPSWRFEEVRIRLAHSVYMQQLAEMMPCIERRDAATLSIAEFRKCYSRCRKAVVISGLGNHLTPLIGEEWLRSTVAHKKVGVYKNGSHRKACPEVEFMEVADYLDLLSSNQNTASYYLYDVSIPKSLPSLLEYLRIPRYFAHDYLTQTLEPTPWARNWPSLFIGSAGSSSSLHIDQWHGSFWMVMISGKKKWTIFHPDDVHMLYPSWSRGTLAPAFPALQDLENNPELYPLFPRARRQVIIVVAGETLFVPGGTPHHVENLSNTIAYAGNFVDDANLDQVMNDVQLLGHLDSTFRDAHRILDQVEFDSSQGAIEEFLDYEHLVVPYDDYISGTAATWSAIPLVNSSFASEAFPEVQDVIDTMDLLSKLEDDGYVILSNALAPDQLNELRRILRSKLYEQIENEKHPPGHPKSCFAKINNRSNRYDLRLMLEGDVLNAAKDIVSGIYEKVYSKLLDKDAPLVELGCITSQPGAEQQAIHSDIDYDNESRRVYTTFVPLQNISSEMGPTRIWPGTHTGYFCEFYKPRMLGPVDPWYDENEPNQMTLEAGDVVLMDTRVMHCGGANSSSEDRMLFHLSFETTTERNAPVGFTYNLMPELKGKYTLGDIQSM